MTDQIDDQTDDQTDIVASRAIVARGSFNLRDLGGLPAADGIVRRGMIYRSDFPGFALRDPEILTSLGLRTVVDLRGSAEIEFECVPWAESGIDHVVCALSAGRESSWHAKYSGYLTHRPAAVVDAVRAIMRDLARPALFHCAAGKDRTGVIAALLLEVLGVDDATIVADYVLTDHALADMLARLRQAGPYAATLAETTDEDQRPLAEAMQSLLDWLHRNGGAAAWLMAHGVASEEIEAFRADLIER